MTKRPLAHIAFVRFLVRVNTHVGLQTTRLTETLLAHFTLVRFLVRVNAHVDFQRIRITKTILAHIALVLPSLSLHSFRSGNNKSLWHVMMILLHHDIFIVFTRRTATAHPQQPKLFVSLFFFSSSPLLFLITFQNRLYVYRSFRMWILSSSSHYCCFYPRIVVVASSCSCSCCVERRTPKRASTFPFWSKVPSSFFFKLHTLNNRKTKSFPLQHVPQISRHVCFILLCAIHSRAFVASNKKRSLPPF